MTRNWMILPLLLVVIAISFSLGVTEASAQTSYSPFSASVWSVPELGRDASSASQASLWPHASVRQALCPLRYPNSRW